MPLYPRPHSPEWFDALEAYNPLQAAHTKFIITLAGRDDVCSICGDHPCSDHQLINDDVDPISVPTFRLCADCREIRDIIFDETFLPYL